jgi:hypothetical protein
VKAKGGDGAAASLLKLAMAQLVQESGIVAVDAAGMHAIAWNADDRDAGRWSDQLLSSLSASIGGGTNQIVRNVIAERVLGLPRDEEGDLMPGDLDRGGRDRGDARTRAKTTKSVATAESTGSAAGTTAETVAGAGATRGH